ncbi:hypothetical protein ACFX2C_040712 [Malus domestica]
MKMERALTGERKKRELRKRGSCPLGSSRRESARARERRAASVQRDKKRKRDAALRSPRPEVRRRAAWAARGEVRRNKVLPWQHVAQTGERRIERGRLLCSLEDCQAAGEVRTERQGGQKKHVARGTDRQQTPSFFGLIFPNFSFISVL